jgi:hypothetical protein
LRRSRPLIYVLGQLAFLPRSISVLYLSQLAEALVDCGFDFAIS